MSLLACGRTCRGIIGRRETIEIKKSVYFLRLVCSRHSPVLSPFFSSNETFFCETRSSNGIFSTGITGEGEETTISLAYCLSATLSYRCLPYLRLVQCDIVNLHFRDFPFEIPISVTSRPHSNFAGGGFNLKLFAN